jgi:hypothetical protein
VLELGSHADRACAELAKAPSDSLEPVFASVNELCLDLHERPHLDGLAGRAHPVDRHVDAVDPAAGALRDQCRETFDRLVAGQVAEERANRVRDCFRVGGDLELEPALAARHLQLPGGFAVVEPAAQRDAGPHQAAARSVVVDRGQVARLERVAAELVEREAFPCFELELSLEGRHRGGVPATALFGT